MSIRITCINEVGGNHSDKHEATAYLGWSEDGTHLAGKWSRIEMYNWINDKKGTAYVQDRFGNRAYVGCRVSRFGNPFVQTHADGKWTDNLLALDECK